MYPKEENKIERRSSTKPRKQGRKYDQGYDFSEIVYAQNIIFFFLYELNELTASLLSLDAPAIVATDVSSFPNILLQPRYAP